MSKYTVERKQHALLFTDEGHASSFAVPYRNIDQVKVWHWAPRIVVCTVGGAKYEVDTSHLSTEETLNFVDSVMELIHSAR